MVLQFKVQLRNIKNPTVWRRIVIPGDYTFEQFHKAIQIAFGWEFEHLYQFQHHPYDNGWSIQPKKNLEFSSFFSDRVFYDAAKTSVFDFLMTIDIAKFVYIYDFGDDWFHDIILENIDIKEELSFPVCLKGKGACPPEDCGGPWGYENMKEAIAKDPNGEIVQEMREWFCLEDDEEFDPAAFDLEETNEFLKQIDNWEE